MLGERGIDTLAHTLSQGQRLEEMWGASPLDLTLSVSLVSIPRRLELGYIVSQMGGDAEERASYHAREGAGDRTGYLWGMVVTSLLRLGRESSGQ